MKRLLGTLGALLLVTVMALAQPSPDTLWTYLYNPTTDERPCGVFTLPDEGYIVGGTIERVGQNDFFLTRINSIGQRNWIEIFGGEFDDEAHGLCLTPDGGYALMGRTRSFGAGSYDFWLVKANYFGDTVWTRTYGSSAAEWGMAIAPLFDGGSALAGYTAGFGAVSYDMLLVRTDALGNERWHRIYDGFGRLDEAFAVAATADSGLVIAGCSRIPDFPNPLQVFVVRTDSTGDTLWTRAVGKAYDDAANAVAQTRDGGFILRATPWRPRPASSWTAIWSSSKATATPSGRAPSAAPATKPSTPCSRRPRAATFSAVMCCPPVPATATCGSSRPTALAMFSGSAPTITATTATRPRVSIRTVMAVMSWPGSPFPAPTPTSRLIRTGPDSVLLPVDDPSSILPPSSFILSAFPNPFNPTTELRFDLPRAARVSLQVFDIVGREVATLIDGVRPSGRHTVTFDATTLPSGLYFARIQSAANTQTQKLILLK